MALNTFKRNSHSDVKGTVITANLLKYNTMETFRNQKYLSFFDQYTGSEIEGANGLIPDKITLFTPTYNRPLLLKRVAECLKVQTCKDFVWVIVNDGSKGTETDEVVKDLLAEEVLPILYISKENGGKHSAFKAGFAECRTEYFICLDDDDIYFPSSVEFFLREWNIIKQEKRDDIGAIRVLTRKDNGRIVATPPVEEDGSKTDCTTLEMIYDRGVSMENWTCYRTAALLETDLFPEGYWMQDQHKFFIEWIWQGRFARKFKCRYINVCLCEYRDDAEVSLIRPNKNHNYYLQGFINNKMVLDEHYDYISKNKKALLKKILLINLLRDYLGVPFKELLKHTPSKALRAYYVLSYPVSLLGERLIKRKMAQRDAEVTAGDRKDS